jgi:hypothetical protein
MTASLSNHGLSARPIDAFEEGPFDEDTSHQARLRGLSHQQLTDRLNWLSWYQPGIFTAVMDYMEFSDALAADTDPASPDPDTLDHYREGAALGQAEIFDPGHAPELAWRLPGSASSGT